MQTEYYYTFSLLSILMIPEENILARYHPSPGHWILTFLFVALFVANLKLCSRHSSLQEALSKFNPWENVLYFLFSFLLKNPSYFFKWFESWILKFHFFRPHTQPVPWTVQWVMLRAIWKWSSQLLLCLIEVEFFLGRAHICLSGFILSKVK